MKNTMVNQAVGEQPAAFVLSDLKSADVWQMTRILKKFDLKSVGEQLDSDALKKTQFQTPTAFVDGKIVPLSPDKWTNAQKKAAKEAADAKDALMWQLLGVLMENIGACESDVNKLLAMGCGCDVCDIANMDATAYLDLIVQYVTREGFTDFFTHAYNLLNRTRSQGSSIASVATLIK